MSAPYYEDDLVTLWHGDSLAILREMPSGSVDCCVTSPPYFGLRDYGQEGQYGLEASPTDYIETMRALFSEVRRVLAADGTLWLNIGDSFNNFRVSQRGQSVHGLEQRGKPAGRRRVDRDLKEKDLMGIPWRTALALQRDGWTLRNDIIWAKPNGMPESVRDRLAAKHEHIFMFSKSLKYAFDLDRLREVGQGTGDVWTVPTQPSPGTHFAVMPQAIAERAVLAGCKAGGTVLDPFSGSGTTGCAATKHGHKYVGIDLNADYLDLSLRTRLAQPGLEFDGGHSGAASGTSPLDSPSTNTSAIPYSSNATSMTDPSPRTVTRRTLTSSSTGPSLRMSDDEVTA